MVNPKMKKAAIVAVALVIVIVALRLTGILTLEPVADVKTTTSPALKGVTLNGAGATFPYPQIVEWIKGFHNTSGVSINYQPVGSGAGLSQFFQNITDFACSDPPLKKSDWGKYRGTVMQIPWIIGAVVVVYNVPEIPTNYNLRLTGDVIAKIYKGDIRFWDDGEIKKLNAEIADRLPHKEIVAAYRSDSSGTTEILTVFLYKSAPNVWDSKLVGKTVEWPVSKVGRGVGGQGNQGVTQVVQTTPYSIGYVEWSFAITNKLQVAIVKNKEGNYVLPSGDTLRAALSNINLPKSPLDDFSHTLEEVVYAGGLNSYPITSPSYIMLWKNYSSRDKALAMSEFLKWVATEGYKNVVPGYVAPPSEVVNLLLKAAETLK